MPELRVDLFLPYLHKADDLVNLVKYLAFTISEGDWLNDWLTHLPHDMQPHVEAVGHWLVTLIG